MAISPPRPPSPDLNTPFYRAMTKLEPIPEETDELIAAEKAATEKWLKEQDDLARKAFLEEARRKQFAHIYKAEFKPKTPVK